MYQWLGGFRPRRGTAWTVALILPILAFLLRLALHSLLGGRAPYFTFFMATLASAALSGFWPGIATTILGALLAQFAFPLVGAGPLVGPKDATVVQFAIAAVVVCLVCESLIFARERARSAEQKLIESERRLQRQAEELRRSNRDLEEFAFVASHDMQEPLRMVNVYTQILLKHANMEKSPEISRYAGYVSEGVERMQRLISDLLEYSRVIHGENEQAPVNTDAAAAEAVKISRDLIDRSNASVVIDPLPMVLAGEAHVIQVFQNLISNAIKYRKQSEPPQVHISARLEANEAVFRVRDNGIGFEPEYSQKVFKLFTRLHGHQYQGSGLGLAICQRIVERYGGRIGVDSKVGEGSTFFFTLPAASDANAHQAAAR